MSLLVSQKNELFQMIEDAGLSANLFTFEPVPSRFDVLPIATRLGYQNSEYAFLFEKRGRRDLHFVLYCPGLHNYESEASPGTDWFLVKAYFKEWLENLKREVGEPDKWKTLSLALSKTKAQFEPSSEGHRQFTVKEHDQLTAKLDQASDRLKELELDEEQIEVIRVKFDHLKKMGRNLSKSDWESLFVGTIVSTMTTLGLSPGTAKAIWDVLREIFGKLLLG